MLPWLIGAAVVGLVAAVASSENEEEKLSRERAERAERRRLEEEEERIRKNIELERINHERKKMIKSIKENFSKEGTTRAQDIVYTLNDILSVNSDSIPTFQAKLDKNSFMSISFGDAKKSLISSLPISTYLDAATHKNLEYFTKSYVVNNLQLSDSLEKKLQKVEEVESVLSKIKEKKKALKLLRKKLNNV